MKKLFTLMAICLGSFTAANAQYGTPEKQWTPEKGAFAVEFGFTPFNTTDGESFKLNEGMLKARYFLTDKDALRLKLGLGINNKTTSYSDVWAPTDVEDDLVYDRKHEIKNKTTSFSIMLGYERHLFTKGRFDVYAGLELGYLMNKNSGSGSFDYTSTNYDGYNVDYTREVHNTYDVSNGFLGFTDEYDANGNLVLNEINPQTVAAPAPAMSNFVANLFAGVDFYVYKKLYLGAEFGLAFKTGSTSGTFLSYSTDSTLKEFNSSGNIEKTSIWRNTYDQEAGKGTKTKIVNGKTDSEPWDYEVKETESSEISFKFFVEPAIRIGWTF